MAVGTTTVPVVAKLEVGKANGTPTTSTTSIPTKDLTDWTDTIIEADKPKTVYISGPMSGLPDFNYPAFNAAAKAWRDKGYKVLNPAENFGGDDSHPLIDYIEADVRHVLDSDIIAVLPGWQKSKGAGVEVALAEWASKPIYNALTFEPYYETALEEAQRLVHGPRGANYGNPLDDFSRTGRIWGPILEPWARDPSKPVPAELVGLCMVGVKISREVNLPKRDNRVDGPGYFETVEMIHLERERRKRLSEVG